VANELSRTRELGIRFIRPQDDKELEKLYRDVEAGIEILHGLIAHGRFKVFASRCPRLIDELRRYRREPFESRWGASWRIVKELNDAVDGTRYGVLGFYKEFDHARAAWLKQQKAAAPGYPVMIEAYEESKEPKDELKLGVPFVKLT